MFSTYRTNAITSTQDSSVNTAHSFNNDIYYFRTSKDTSYGVDPLHSHNFIQMWYVLSGTYRHVFGNREFILGKGSLLVVPPFCEHYLDTRLSDDSALYRCEFSEKFINNTQDREQHNSLFNLVYLEPVLFTANLIEPYLYFEGESAEEIETVFSELYNEYYKNDSFSSVFIRAKIIELLAIISKRHQAISTLEHNKMFAEYRLAIQNALDYIHSNYMKKIYLKEISKIALMSPRYFSYIFKQITGCTFTEYLQYLRVLKARELLVSTDRTQYDISKECGFIDTSYFHRTFKKLTGCLPGQYRNSHSQV